MKRKLSLAMCMLMLLAGCNKQIAQTRQPEQVKNEVEYKTGVYRSRFWEAESIEDSNYCVIPDEEAAVKIATAIYQELPIHTYTAQSVFYDEKDEVWIVKFHFPIPESGPVATDLPVHTIALQKKDGKVLSIRVN